MNEYCYIFLLRQDNVCVYRYYDNGWCLVTRDGLGSFPFQDTEKLIEWWKKEASYIDEENENVDLLFLSDTQDTKWDCKILENTFQFVKNKSVWSLNRLKEFFRQFDEMQRVNLVISENMPQRMVKDSTPRPMPENIFKFYAFPNLDNETGEEAEAEPDEEPAEAHTPNPGTPEIFPSKPNPERSSGDGTGDALFRYFKNNVQNY